MNLSATKPTPVLESVTLVVQTVELSEEGRSFLHHLFLAFDENQDALLSDAEQSEMFSAAPTRYHSPLPPPPCHPFILRGAPCVNAALCIAPVHLHVCVCVFGGNAFKTHKITRQSVDVCVAVAAPLMMTN